MKNRKRMVKIMENQRKERKSFRKVFLMIPMLLLTIATLSVATYAWWNTLQTNKNVEVPIGEGTQLDVSVGEYIPAGKVLVPAGKVLWSTQIDKVVIEYNVTLSGKVDDGGLDFDVTLSNLLIGSIDSYNSLVLVTIDIVPEPVTIHETPIEFVVTVTVTLNEPESKADYDAIINEDITFTLTFKATPLPTP